MFPCLIYLTGGRLACVDFSVDLERLPFVGKFGEKIPSNGTGIFWAQKTGILCCTIYKIPLNFSLSLDLKPGTGNPNKWNRKFRSFR